MLKRFTTNKLFTGSVYILLSSVINRLIIYSLVPLYTKVLTPFDYGIVGYYQAILLLLQIVIGLGLYGVQTRLYHDYKHNKEQLGELLFLINFMIVGVGLGAATLNFFLADLVFGNVVSDPTQIKLIKLLPFIAMVQALNINNNNFLLVRQKFRKLFVQKISESLFIAAAIMFFLLVKKDGALADFEGNLAGSILFLILFAPSYLRSFQWKINPTMVKVSLSLGLPLVLHGSANILVNIGDRFILKQFMDISNIGIYTLAYQIGQVMSVVTNSINQAWQAQFLKKMTIDKNYNPNKETTLIAIVNSMIGVGITAGTLLCFDFLFDVRYELVKKITPVVIISYLIHYFYAISNSLIFLNKKNHLLATITVATVIMNFTLNYILIPQLGIIGAAYAAVLTMAFRSLVTIVISEKIQPKVFSYTRPFVIIAAACVVISAMIFFNSKYSVTLLSTLYIIPTITILIYLSRKTTT